MTCYPHTIEEVLGDDVEHEVLLYTANPIEQSHRGIKHRYYPMLGFGEFETAQRFCQAFDEVRNFLRPQRRMGEFVSLFDRREHFLVKVKELEEIFLAAKKQQSREGCTFTEWYIRSLYRDRKADRYNGFHWGEVWLHI